MTSKAKPADFSISDILAWARTKPADEEYDSCEPKDCAIAQFGMATGRKHLVDLSDLHRVVPLGVETAIMLSSTFGELVSELERIVEPSPRKRLWAKITGKTIGGTFTPPVSDTWTRADAYLTDIEVVEVA